MTPWLAEFPERESRVHGFEFQEDRKPVRLFHEVHSAKIRKFSQVFRPQHSSLACKCAIDRSRSIAFHDAAGARRKSEPLILRVELPHAVNNPFSDEEYLVLAVPYVRVEGLQEPSPYERFFVPQYLLIQFMYRHEGIAELPGDGFDYMPFGVVSACAGQLLKAYAGLEVSGGNHPEPSVNVFEQVVFSEAVEHGCGVIDHRAGEIRPKLLEVLLNFISSGFHRA